MKVLKVRYSRWDGRQDEFSMDVKGALDALSDLMMEGLDAQQALEMMRQYGFELGRHEHARDGASRS